MKINTLRIAGRDFKVELVKGLADFGSTDFLNNKILIKDGINEDNIESTLVHECLEALNEIYDLNLSHQTLQTLEAGIFQIIKDNKL